MRAFPRLAWAGLALQFLAVFCFGIVVAGLSAIERVDENASGFWIDTFEARLAQRWVIVGVVLMLAGAALLAKAVVAARRR